MAPKLPLVEILWFRGCANYSDVRTMVRAVVLELGAPVVIREIDASDPAVASALRFPGSPTVRVDGRDVEPGFGDPGDYTPRCRLYRTAGGLGGLPEREWIRVAIAAASREGKGDGPGR